MHKGWFQIITVLTGMMLILLSQSGMLYGQAGIIEHNHVLDIQQSFLRGEMDADVATLKQFRLLYAGRDGQTEYTLHKCATPVHMFVHRFRDQISTSVLKEVEGYQQASEYRKNSMTQTYISPSGKFQIEYEISGPDSVSVIDNDENGVPDYVDLVAESADSTYRHEILTLGFTDPIPEGSTYRIVLENISFYGETRTTGSSPQTYIRIENDFENFPPNSHPDGDAVGAVYATVAHEFKHAIQYAQNRWAAPSGALDWAEMDATLFEEVVYDDVNDYYNYIKNGFNSTQPYSASIFNDPSRGTPVAYYHVSWMIFYSELFGDDIWMDVWSLIEAENNLSIDDALRQVLPDRGADFSTTFVQNHLWHFASGPRSGADDYGFGEKTEYPFSNMEETFSGVPVDSESISSVGRLAARYYEVFPGPNDNGFIDVAVDFDSSQVGVGLLFYMKNGDMQEIVETGEGKGQVYIPTDIAWENIDRLGVVLANHSGDVTTRDLSLAMGKDGNSITVRDPEYVDLPKSVKVFPNYPNPFNPETNIDFELPGTAFVELEVFDITGRKVSTLTNRMYRIGYYSIPFDAGGLSSGIYIYRLRINDAVFTRKMTLVK